MGRGVVVVVQMLKIVNHNAISDKTNFGILIMFIFQNCYKTVLLKNLEPF